jgi:hypothetical protein
MPDPHCQPRTDELPLLALDICEKLWARIEQHRSAIAALREEEQVLQELHRSILNARRSRRLDVTTRWRFRGAVRALKKTLTSLKPAPAPGLVRPTEALDEQVAGSLLLRLQACAQPIPPQATGPGIYFLFDDDNLSYVGKSISVMSRLVSHVGTKSFTRAAFMPCDQGELDRVERLLIDHFLPRDNADGRTLSLRNRT